MILTNNTFDMSETYIGKVMKTDRDNRCCYVFIPKLMMTLSSSEIVDNKIPMNLSKIENKEELNIGDFVNKGNLFKVKQLNINSKLPDVGSLVIIFFIDGDIKKGYFYDFNPNNSLKYIEEEKYLKLFNLNINHKSIDIKEEDNIQINLPEYFNIIYLEEDKNKIINIVDNSESEIKIKQLNEEVKSLTTSMKYLVNKFKHILLDKLKELLTKSNDITIDDIKNSLNIILSEYIRKIEYENNFDEFDYIEEISDIKTNGIINTLDNIYVYENKINGVTDNDYILKEEEINNIKNNIKEIIYSDSIEFINKQLDMINENVSVEKTINFLYNTEIYTTITGELLSYIENGLPYGKPETYGIDLDENYSLILEHYSDKEMTKKYTSTTINKNMNVYSWMYELDFEFELIKNNDDIYLIVIMNPDSNRSDSEINYSISSTTRLSDEIVEDDSYQYKTELSKIPTSGFTVTVTATYGDKTISKTKSN